MMDGGRVERTCRGDRVEAEIKPGGMGGGNIQDTSRDSGRGRRYRGKGRGGVTWRVRLRWHNLKSMSSFNGNDDNDSDERNSVYKGLEELVDTDRAIRMADA